MNKNDVNSGFDRVQYLCEQWPWLTLNNLRELFTADCEYLNMPAQHLRCVGPDQVFKLLDGFISPWKLDLQLVHIQGDNNTVLTERLERFEHKSGNGVIVELEVMGAFQLRDGKISHWRDYFDSQQAKPLLG
jgi:limonene-1,2-epoxide hydrolase